MGGGDGGQLAPPDGILPQLRQRVQQQVVGVGPQPDEGAVDLETVLAGRLADLGAHGRPGLLAGARIEQIETELNVLQSPSFRHLPAPDIRFRPPLGGVDVIDTEMNFHVLNLLRKWRSG